MKLTLETNPRNCLDVQLHLPSSALLLMTAPLRDECWLFRIRLQDNLTLVAVPQFGGVNICLRSKRADEVTMPYESNSRKILKAIGPYEGKVLSDGRCMEAIRMLRVAVSKWRGV